MKTLKDVIVENYNEQTVAFAGLTDRALKGIIFYITQVLRFQKYRLEIHVPPKEPTVIIHLFLVDTALENPEIYVKLKNPKDLDDLAEFLGIPNYKIKLAEKPKA